MNKILNLFRKTDQVIPALKFPKLLYSPEHQFISYPKNRISYLGISDYAKRCLVADSIKLRTTINAAVRESVLYFQGNIFSDDDDPLSMLENIPESLIIRKGEQLLTMETKDSDWALIAPVDLRVIKINEPTFDESVPLTIFKWLLKIEVVNQKQLEELLNEEEYEKMWKTFRYQ